MPPFSADTRRCSERRVTSWRPRGSGELSSSTNRSDRWRRDVRLTKPAATASLQGSGCPALQHLSNRCKQQHADLQYFCSMPATACITSGPRASPLTLSSRSDVLHAARSASAPPQHSADHQRMVHQMHRCPQCHELQGTALARCKTPERLCISSIMDGISHVGANNSAAHGIDLEATVTSVEAVPAAAGHCLTAGSHLPGQTSGFGAQSRLRAMSCLQRRMQL